MKYKLLPIIFLSFVNLALSQQSWTGSTLDALTYRTGSVGIGTASPGGKLHIQSDDILLRLTGSNYVSKTPFDVINLGLNPNGSGAFNLTFRVGYPYSAGVNAYGRLDVLKILNGNTILATDESNAGLGNVGIGTSTPQGKLHILSNDVLLRLSGSNYVSKTPLDIINLGLNPNGSGAFNIAFRIGYPHLMGVDASNKLDLIKAVNGSTILGTDETGQSLGAVGIGTVTPDPAYKLSVNGSIRAKEIKVNTGWSDFVFFDTYKLRPLSEVETFIEENKHLPDVPSAAVVEKEGVNLGEMDAILLRKIEELTLYVIELKKESSLQKNEIQLLKEKNIVLTNSLLKSK